MFNDYVIPFLVVSHSNTQLSIALSWQKNNFGTNSYFSPSSLQLCSRALSFSLSFYLSATTIRLRMSVCVFFFLALFFYCDCCDCLLFGLFSTFIVLFLSFEFCDFIRQIQSDIHHTHQNKLNKVYSCRNNKYFILSLFLLYLLLFFLLLNSFIDRLSKSSNCHSASVFIYVCCLYCLCLVLFAPLTEIWKYALQSWRVQWTSNCSRLKNVCTCVCRSYFSSCINSSCILFALLTLWLSSVTLHRFFFYLAVFLLLLYLQQMCLPCKKRQCYGSKIKNAEKRYRSHCVPFCSSIPNECRNSTVELSSRSYLAATCPLALQIKTTQWKIKHTEHISIIISASQHQQFNSVECMFGVSDDETLCYRWIISNRIVRHFLRLNLSENVLNWMR